jgi:sporulation protein YlmC with PRC-barrel domain
MTTVKAPPVLSASTIVGDKVQNREGQQLGSIKELMIDTATGRIAYAVLDFGGFLGLGTKFFSVPWPALTVSSEQKVS